MTQNEYLRGQRINPKPITGKETTSFAQSSGVVREKCIIDEVRDRFLAGDRFGIDALAAEEFVLRHRVDWLIGCMAR